MHSICNSGLFWGFGAFKCVYYVEESYDKVYVFYLDEHIGII